MGSALFALNRVPVRFQDAPCFKNLHATDPPADGLMPIRPRTGAFEIYVQSLVGGRCYAQCIFSKLASGVWPHIPSVVKKLAKAVEALEEGKDITIFEVERLPVNRSASIPRSSPPPLRPRSTSKPKVGSYRLIPSSK